VLTGRRCRITRAGRFCPCGDLEQTEGGRYLVARRYDQSPENTRCATISIGRAPGLMQRRQLTARWVILRLLCGGSVQST